MKNTIITQITPIGKSIRIGPNSRQLIAQIKLVPNHAFGFKIEVMKKLNQPNYQELNNIEKPVAMQTINKVTSISSQRQS